MDNFRTFSFTRWRRNLNLKYLSRTFIIYTYLVKYTAAFQCVNHNPSLSLVHFVIILHVYIDFPRSLMFTSSPDVTGQYERNRPRVYPSYITSPLRGYVTNTAWRYTHTHIYIPVLYCKQSYCTNTPRVVHYPSWPFVVKKSWGLVREQLSIWFGKCLNLPTFL